MTVREALELFEATRLKGREKEIARDILPEIGNAFLFQEVGLVISNLEGA